MTYRDAAGEERKVVHVLHAHVAKGERATFRYVYFGALVTALSIPLGVFWRFRYGGDEALLVSAFGVILLVLGARLAWTRRRRIEIIREGRRAWLSCERGPELSFPLAIAGREDRIRARNATIRAIFLELRSPDGKAIVLRGGLGLIHDEQPDWPTGYFGREPDYTARGPALVELRRTIQRITKELE